MRDGATKWAEVDLDAIAHNARTIGALIGPATALMAVVKANGYGHGAVPCARAALRGGAAWLGVSSADEGLELRRAGIQASTLILGYTPEASLAAAAEHIPHDGIAAREDFINQDLEVEIVVRAELTLCVPRLREPLEEKRFSSAHSKQSQP